MFFRIKLKTIPVQIDEERQVSIAVVEDPSSLHAILPSENKHDLWSFLWGASFPLAFLLTVRSSLQGLQCLEIGCGTGLATICAARNGAQVMATDFHPFSLQLCKFNADSNSVSNDSVQYRTLNWHNALDPDLSDRYQLVVASDVLFMGSAISPIIRVLQSCLTQDGVALIVDPGRSNFDDFVDRCADAGLAAKKFECPSFETSFCVLKLCVVIVVSKLELSQTCWPHIEGDIRRMYQRLGNSPVLKFGFCAQ